MSPWMQSALRSASVRKSQYCLPPPDRRYDRTSGRDRGSDRRGRRSPGIKSSVPDRSGRERTYQRIVVTPQMVSKIKDGRASIRPTGEEDLFIPCTTLIVAIGQDIESGHFEQADFPVMRGRLMSAKMPASRIFRASSPAGTVQPVHLP